ncbi:hypothetical protein WN51_14324 [Melipona quadrifasciata]|uniref:Uncharacterized protein n=1 Tax=Melipona quadrifasciata TaxID=166423 RepID=A0A0N0U5C5_9HYME|nr:hypothetical protein WN51_14324 [Melipona quadrifasciata]
MSVLRYFGRWSLMILLRMFLLWLLYLEGFLIGRFCLLSSLAVLESFWWSCDLRAVVMSLLGWNSQFIFGHSQGLLNVYVAVDKDSVDLFIGSHSNAAIVEVLKIIFLERVPQSHDVNQDADLITLALLADRVMEFRPSYIASISRLNMVTSAWQPRAEEYQRGDNMATSAYQARADEWRLLRRTCLGADHFNDDLNSAIDDLHHDNVQHQQEEVEDFVTIILISACQHTSAEHRIYVDDVMLLLNNVSEACGVADPLREERL